MSEPPPFSSPAGRPRWWLAIAMLATLGATVGWLRFEGRAWWCRLGDWSPWSSGISSPHTSQHLFDPYSFTHVLHGLLLYALCRWAAGKLGRDARFALIVGVESVWEAVENSSKVIDRYRQGTIALGYDGDSVANSLGDIASCAFGAWLAARLPVRWSMALFLTVELGLLAVYRDNLLLNVIMLIHPVDAIRQWQSGH